ncbi:MAG: MobC family plasmid mobilization relaxosome protein [Candidatus Humimicrobiaceae bacterium]
MSRKRKNLVGFWLDDNEYLSLKNKIAHSGLTCSGYLRKSSLDKNITVIPGIRDLIIEIKRIGNNLNQITRLANEGSLTILGDNLKNIKEGLKEVWESLAKTLKKI